MKKLIGTCLVVLGVFTMASAQSNQEEIDFIQSIFGMEKKAVISNFIQLDEAAAAEFWAVYDAYEVERKALGQNRMSLINDYVNNYGSMSDEKMDEVINATIKQKAATDKLITKYYKKLNKVSGSKVSGQFYQIEVFILNIVRAAIFENIPLIGEMDIINN
ncbi:MAG: hypothetical protein RIC80_10260 [Cyclobacteriaceae bacterium]